MLIAIDDPARADIAALLAEHLADMFATSPLESVHALDVAALKVPAITFFSARDADMLLAVGALKELDAAHVEIKSMRTTAAARGTGVGRAMLAHVVAQAREQGYARISLETGIEDYFAPARRLYEQNAFVVCGPFGSYVPDPNSVFMTLEL
ncbi:MAG TPA: GNAT family N-acetyltransferase [Marmoricola sp.]|nr:GNAT family N-acetyltransferase [Marmoricola sp.]